jgi:hypothetical protein
VTIEETQECAVVVDDLTRIVDWCRTEQSALGIFPAMYRTVTVTVGEGIEAGVFDDPARVERLVVEFARLYIEAFDAMVAGVRPASSWDLAFRFAERGKGSISQHLLLGMNAHINLDLGIATAAVSTPDDLAALHDDFVRVNDVLFTLVDELQDCLGALSPWMARLDRLGLGLDEACMRSGIAFARSRAWSFSERLIAAADEPSRTALVVARDDDTSRVGKVICHRLSMLHLANRVVSWRECRDLPRVIDTMSSARIDVADVLAPS